MQIKLRRTVAVINCRELRTLILRKIIETASIKTQIETSVMFLLLNTNFMDICNQILRIRFYKISIELLKKKECLDTFTKL